MVAALFDQIACPTPSWWLSDVILEIIQNKTELFSNNSIKILHATAKGEVSWYDFAKQILKHNVLSSVFHIFGIEVGPRNQLLKKC